MTRDHALAIIASYFLVAAIGWTYGYICRVWIERRARELDSREPVPMCDIIDLAEPAAPYDWAVRLDSGVGDPPGSWPAVITFR